MRSAFIESFRKNKLDEGLLMGIAAIEAELAVAKREKKLPQAEQPLTRRIGRVPRESSRSRHPPPARRVDRFRQGTWIGSDPRRPGQAPGDPQPGSPDARGARTIIAAATEQAASMNLKVNIAVVDDGGHLLSFDRMNGARPASGYTAITKATTAATFRQPTGPIPAGTTNPIRS